MSDDKLKFGLENNPDITLDNSPNRSSFAAKTANAEKASAKVEAQLKEMRVKQFRAEASRKASLANKRIQRLEKAGLKDSPAYQRYIKDGGQRFGVKGKTYREVQSEVARLDRFISSQTSTIKGVNTVLKEMAENTGIKYKNLTELRAKSAKFFELSSKVEQYLRTVDDMASAIGYQKIWEVINTYTQQAKVDLSDADLKIDNMVETITNALKEQDEPVKDIGGSNWYVLKDE